MKYDLYSELNPYKYFERKSGEEEKNKYMNMWKKCNKLQEYLGLKVGSEKKEDEFKKTIETEEGKKEIEFTYQNNQHYEIIGINYEQPQKYITLKIESRSNSNPETFINRMEFEFEHGIYIINSHDRNYRQVLSYYNREAIETVKKLSKIDYFSQWEATHLGIVPDQEVDFNLNEDEIINFFVTIVKSKKEKVDMFLQEFIESSKKEKNRK